MSDVVDSDAHWQLRLQFLGRRLAGDVMLPSVVASDPAHDPTRNLNARPVEALKKPHVLSTYNRAFRAIQKQREHERLP